MNHRANPWDQRPGESSQAFIAFRSYLELGQKRTVLDAFRAKSGKPESQQVSGRWGIWSREHEWAERARAFDASILAQVDKGAARAARGRGERLNVGLDNAIERALAAGERMMARGMQWLDMPTVETEEVEDGKKYIVKPANPKHHRIGGMLIRDGLALIEHARDRVFQQMREEERSSATSADGVDSRVRAAREMDAWREEQNRKLIEHQQRILETHAMPTAASASGA